jgi:CNT family concentrative nucleoside transporter
MLKDHVEGIAGHLIASSVMGAPASLVISKLMMPETDQPETLGADPARPPRTTTNVIDALAAGAIDGLKLAVNVAAMLIVFLSVTAMIDAALGFVGEHAGVPLSLDRIFAWVFYPIAWTIGVPAEDVHKLAALLGQKTALNEFVAYASMSQALSADPTFLTERGRTLAAYALCGFANFGSIGIQLGGYSGIAPERRSDLSRLALRTMFGGFLATNLVACVAGVLL